ncbi:hypothetical protein SLA2020_495360, partial [Shorea laevis]
LWTFLVPALTPHEANESEGNRGLSHSERACGVGKLEFVTDMVETPKKRRCFGGKERNLGGKETDWWA